MDGILGFVFIVLLGTVTAEPKQDLNWWQTATIYQIYPRSYQDSDGSGTGDIKGIESRVDYIADLGVNAVWLSPVYKSPMADFGYDISDFVDIDPLFGTLDDLRGLLAAMKERGIRLIMDIVPNHSSDEHEWFIRSVNREDPYTDYYMWVPANGTNPDGSPRVPNNWLSIFGGSAWEWNDQRQEFYLHQFAIKQPDLNYRNPLVLEEMKNVIKFWLDFGADGLRVDAIAHLFEDVDLRDEPPSGIPNTTPNQSESLNHIYTQNLPEVLDVVGEFRSVLDQKTAEDGIPKIMMVETYMEIEKTMEYYGTVAKPLASFPFNFQLMYLNGDITAQNVYDAVHLWLDNLPEGAWPNWVLGNHDQRRLASRQSPEVIDAMNIIELLLQGTALTYFGEETGMVNGNLTYEETVDPWGCNFGPDRYNEFSRDPQRTPMQWDATKNAGFSDADKTWLPVNPNYVDLNVEAQTMAAESHLSVYKALVAARRSPAITEGALDLRVLPDEVLAFTRILDLEGTEGFLIVVNLGNAPTKADASVFQNIPEQGTVYIHSIDFADSNVQIGSQINTNQIPLGPNEGIVLIVKPSMSSKKEIAKFQ